MTEYKVHDLRTGQEVYSSYYPDTSGTSEKAAIRRSGVPGQFAKVETRELSDEAAREYVRLPDSPLERGKSYDNDKAQERK